jgi:hypothetical protein
MLSSILSKFLITDQKTGQVSYTLTVFMYGSVVINLKLLFAGFSIGDSFKMSPFSGVDYGAAMGGIGMVYTLRKNNSIKPNAPDGDK